MATGVKASRNIWKHAVSLTHTHTHIWLRSAYFKWHFAACPVITISNEQKNLHVISFPDAGYKRREWGTKTRNWGCKETVSRTGELSKILIKREMLFFFLYLIRYSFVLNCLPIITGIIRVNSGRTPVQVRSIKLTLVFREYYNVVQSLMFTHPGP